MLSNITFLKYTTILTFFFFGFFFSITLITVSYYLNLGMESSYLEKNKIYECGFESLQSIKKKSLLSFFKVAVLFLLFDLEIIFFIPWILILESLSLSYSLYSLWVMWVFLILLTLGFFFEWSNNLFEKI